MTQTIRNIRDRKARRGVTLLLVLGLMTMFAMLVVTFMVVTTQAMKTSESVAAVALEYPTGVSGVSGAVTVPTPNFNRALNALLVGGLDTVIGPHSILENLYGHPDTDDTDNLKGTVTLDSTIDALNNNSPIIAVVDVELSAYDYGDYKPKDLFGGVLTLTKSGKSAIIIDIEEGNDPDKIRLYVTSPRIAELQTIFANTGDDIDCIINSPAFGGTGVGYRRPGDYENGSDIPLISLRDEDIDGNGGFTALASFDDADEDGLHLALRPNPLAPDSNGDQQYKKYLEKNIVLTNPDYTAPDYQNMFLAWNEVEEASGSYYITEVIPSFHRPNLVRYWEEEGELTDADSLRKVVLRPLRQDHPNFTGSNQATADVSANDVSSEATFLINGPWDVDNDGDGVQDGIWLDLGGEPVEIGGKLFKQLYSFYVLDMDGRLNVNAHGTTETLQNGNAVDTATGGLTDTYGLGTGVAEIRLGEGLAQIGGSENIENLLKGNGEQTGRYGEDGYAGEGGEDNTMEENILQAMGVWYGAYATPSDGSYTDGYGNLLPDFWGTAAILLDPLGNRRFDTDGPYFAQNPYMVNPYGDDVTVDTSDNPFKGIDLEFIIRSVGDRSFRESLSTTRLRYLLGSDEPERVTKFSKYRHFVTTRSSDIPAASTAGANGYRGFAEYAGVTYSDDLTELLPPELLRGEKVSLDRIMFLEASFADGSNPEELLKQKARFAQEMFYLVLVLCPEITNGTDPDKRKADIARVAQWCVNLVDFLDVDDVMTPLVFHETDPLGEAYDFMVDFDAFYGGGTYTVSSGCRLIWGMEQPEVALTKTFATHNRRIADSKFGFDVDLQDGNNADARDTIHKDVEHGNTPCECDVHLNRIAESCTCTPPASASPDLHTHDTTFDQVMIPQGSLFLELYRLGNPNKTIKGASTLCDDNNALNLAQTVPGSTVNTPVWRIAISVPAKTKPGDIDETGANWNSNIFEAVKIGDADANAGTYDFQPHQWPNGSQLPDCQVKLERFIWFGSAVPDIPDFSDLPGCSYRNFGSPGEVDDSSMTITAGSAALTNVLLEPNDYLVIGPRSFTSFESREYDEDNEEASSFGIPTMEEGSYIDLRKLNPRFHDDGLGGAGTGDQSFKSPKIMIAASSNIDTWNTGPLGPALASGIGVSISEPLPGADDYYDMPTGSASTKMIEEMGATGENSVKDSYTDDNDVCKKPTEKELPFIRENEEDKDGTIAGFRSVFLQRLADPTREYNSVTNPYITVDWNMIDLHIFNSEKDKASAEAEPIDANAHGDLYFALRQWGYTNRTADEIDSLRPNVFDRSYDRTKMTTNDCGLGGSDPGNPVSSLDPRLKKEMVLGRYSITGASDGTSQVRMTKSQIESAELDAKYVGAPINAFLHLPWNNGPLSNAYELMLVPASSPSRFGFEFCMQSDTIHIREWWRSVPSLGNDESDDNKTMPICNPDIKIGPYFNFFNIGNVNAGDPEPVLARLFDFVRVPSRFNGTIQGVALDDDRNRPAYRMREPGKINLNTANQAAWEALRMNDPDFVDYATFKALRETKDSTSGTLPTYFASPFRSSMSGNMVPIKDLTLQNSALFTRNVTGDDPANPEQDPMFKPSNPAPTITGGTTNKGTNQLTALENVIRRGDLLTNRSNVFAVWVTVGYFEVEKFNSVSDLQIAYPGGELGHISGNNFSVVYPGGYVLGKEKGLTDGSVARHRYFYLIDRTVPVGFRRGKTDLNHQDVIIHSRRLE